MDRRRLVIPLLVFVAVLGVAVSGCGGKSDGQTSYSDSTQGLSLDYQPPLSEVPSAVNAESLGADFANGFIDTEGGGLDDGTFAGLVVTVSGSGLKTPSAGAYSVARKAWFLLGDRKVRKLGGFELFARKSINLNGIPAWLYEGEGTLQGRRFHFTNVAIVAGDRLYELIGQWPTSAADTSGDAVQSAIYSFSLSDGAREAAIASGKTAGSVGEKDRSYANAEYHFRLRVPAGFQQLSADEMPNASQGAFAVGFADSSTGSDLGAGDQLLTAFIVQVGDLGRALSPAEATQLVHAMASSDTARASSKQAMEAMYGDLKMGDFEISTLGKRVAMTFDLSYTSSQGTKQRQRVYTLVSDKYIYQLQLEASQSSWGADKRTLERMAQSFRIL